MDPSVYYQTDAPYYRRITQITFLRLLKRGLVYKGTYPVNWCPRCITALADAEVEYDEGVTKLNYIKFGIKGSHEHVLIATTRPELICTCQLIAVHPEDERFKHLVGKTLVTPFYHREVRVVADPNVDPNFGTGVVMICTIGDKGDLEWVMKYKLTLERGIEEQGRMTEVCGKYAGMKVKEARQAIIRDLDQAGLIARQEALKQNVSICWRCHEPIEYLNVPQWFLKTLPFREQVLKIADQVNWHPEFMKVRLQDWVNSLGWDWVISRQRYFATPIPLWECAACAEVVPAREEDCYIDPTVARPPVPACPKCGGELKACTDVFDTWMDSSISPLYCTFWMRDEERFKKLYPMSLRPQSHDIIRTWAFYTILREYLMTDQKPWNDIMIHGFIMAPDGTPMHTSLNNVIDPMPILEMHGADAVRYYACTCALGEDNAFREKDVVHGGKLRMKLYNMGRFAGSFVKEKPTMEGLHITDRWILSRFTKTLRAVTEHYENYEFDRAMRDAEQFAWHEFADHYLEMVKHRTKDPNDAGVRFTTYIVTLGIMKMIAPLMPHVTEEVYQDNFKQFDGAISIHVSDWPAPVLIDDGAERQGELVKDIIGAVRNWKAESGIALNQEVASIEIIGEAAALLAGCEADIIQTVKAAELKLTGQAELEERVTGFKPVLAKIGPIFKAQGKEITDAIKGLEPKAAAMALQSGELEVTLKNGSRIPISADLVEMRKELTLRGKAVATLRVDDLLVAIQK
jgi:valyl-tRNA synthetase